MASFQEIGQGYAKRVRAAIEEDRKGEFEYVKKAYAHQAVEPEWLKRSNLIRALKEIARETDQVKVGGKPLTDAQKEEVYREAGQALGLPEPKSFGYMAKGASNDAYMQMTNYISVLIAPAGGKK